jgi:hypothetical protein
MLVTATAAELREVIEQIHKALWPNGPNSPWDSETIEEVARIMDENGFGPTADE